MENSPSSLGREPERLAEGSWRERRCRDGSRKRERLVHWGDETSSHRRGRPVEMNTHLSPLHWQSGTEEFHEDKSKFSLLPWSEGLIFPRRRTASAEYEDIDEAAEDEEEEEEDSFRAWLVELVMEKRRRRTWRKKSFGTSMKIAESRERERERERRGEREWGV